MDIDNFINKLIEISNIADQNQRYTELNEFENNLNNFSINSFFEFGICLDVINKEIQEENFKQLCFSKIKEKLGNFEVDVSFTLECFFRQYIKNLPDNIKDDYIVEILNRIVIISIVGYIKTIMLICENCNEEKYLNIINNKDISFQIDSLEELSKIIKSIPFNANNNIIYCIKEKIIINGIQINSLEELSKIIKSIPFNANDNIINFIKEKITINNIQINSLESFTKLIKVIPVNNYNIINFIKEKTTINNIQINSIEDFKKLIKSMPHGANYNIINFIKEKTIINNIQINSLTDFNTFIELIPNNNIRTFIEENVTINNVQINSLTDSINLIDYIPYDANNNTINFIKEKIIFNFQINYLEDFITLIRSIPYNTNDNIMNFIQEKIILNFQINSLKNFITLMKSIVDDDKKFIQKKEFFNFQINSIQDFMILINEIRHLNRYDNDDNVDLIIRLTKSPNPRTIIKFIKKTIDIKNIKINSLEDFNKMIESIMPLNINTEVINFMKEKIITNNIRISSIEDLIKLIKSIQKCFYNTPFGPLLFNDKIYINPIITFIKQKITINNIQINSIEDFIKIFKLIDYTQIIDLFLYNIIAKNIQINSIEDFIQLSILVRYQGNNYIKKLIEKHTNINTFNYNQNILNDYASTLRRINNYKYLHYNSIKYIIKLVNIISDMPDKTFNIIKNHIVIEINVSLNFSNKLLKFHNPKLKNNNSLRFIRDNIKIPEKLHFGNFNTSLDSFKTIVNYYGIIHCQDYSTLSEKIEDFIRNIQINSQENSNQEYINIVTNAFKEKLNNLSIQELNILIYTNFILNFNYKPILQRSYYFENRRTGKITNIGTLEDLLNKYGNENNKLNIGTCFYNTLEKVWKEKTQNLMPKEIASQIEYNITSEEINTRPVTSFLKNYMVDLIDDERNHILTNTLTDINNKLLFEIIDQFVLDISRLRHAKQQLNKQQLNEQQRQQELDLKTTELEDVTDKIFNQNDNTRNLREKIKENLIYQDNFSTPIIYHDRNNILQRHRSIKSLLEYALGEKLTNRIISGNNDQRDNNQQRNIII